MNPKITYWSNAASDSMPLELSVSGGDEAVLRVGSNRFSVSPASVGEFRARLAPQLTTPIINAMRSPAFAAVQSPVSVTPGEVIRTLRIEEADGAIVGKYVGEQAAPPAAFSAAEQEALKLISLVSRMPVHALDLEVSPPPAGFNRGQSVSLALTWLNPGSEPIGIPGIDQWEAQGVRLLANAVRSDIPETRQEPHHQKFESFAKNQIAQLHGADMTTPMIRIAPAQKVSLVLEKQLDWPPGQYAVTLAFIFPLFDGKGEAIMRCELVSKAVAMTCGGDPKPGDLPEKAAN